MPSMTNEAIARQLERVADLLERKGDNPFRIISYRRAAQEVRQSARSMTELLDWQGVEGLRQLPGIGVKLSAAIQEIIERGRFAVLDRLESETSPEMLLMQVPGIGQKLARRIHEELGIGSLEELELAAHDGRLESIEGLRGKTLAGIRSALAGMLSRTAGRRARLRVKEAAPAAPGGVAPPASGAGAPAPPAPGEQPTLPFGEPGVPPAQVEEEAEAAAEAEAEAAARAAARRQAPRLDRPPVELLLDVDYEYRQRAAAGELIKIAPRRFNPEGKRWLPVLRTRREDWNMVALYSNTARAHELGKTEDWVIIYSRRAGIESQNTVVTAASGPFKNMRVVRGRETECRMYYRV